MVNITNGKNNVEYLVNEIELYKKNIERLELIFEAAKEGMWDMDDDGNVRFFNSSFYKNFDVSLDKSTLNEWIHLVHPEDKHLFSENVVMQKIKRIEVFKSQYRVKNKNNEYVWIEAIGKAQYDADGNMIFMVGAHVDITERKEHEKKILFMAYHDNLTSLPNRNLLEKYINEGIKNCKSGALLYINVKDFKYVNDVFGYDIGDKALIRISKKLEKNSGNDGFVSRISGNEFVLLLDSIFNRDKIEQKVKYVLEELEQKIDIEGRIIKISTCIGIARFPNDGIVAKEIIQNANFAMTIASKKITPSYEFFDLGLRNKLLRERTIDNSLKTALENNELFICYQPIICAKTGKVASMEALLRWNNVDLGVVSPFEFIPIAEKNNAINKIGDFVLEEACRQGNILNEKYNAKLRVAVNVSVIQLMQNGFVSKVISIIENTGVDKNNVILEITESCAIETNIDIIEKIVKLRDYGILIVVDDFGAGYSSINNLIQLPIAGLKIDKSIIEKSLANDNVFYMMQAVVAYAHNMKMTVVAEGVEDKLMLDRIRGLNVNYIQGFYYSKPISFNEVIEYMENNKSI
ncbi:MAG: GGDEF and EAL domain-containing protein [Clostridiales bacterium]|nr:GGDEF and EAL domain-containing protein [Clostridiales bacterium]